MKRTVQSKLPNVGVTIFTEMSALAEEYNAVNLSQGFPDFSVDPELINLVNRYMIEGKNQYAPMQGLLALREGISQKNSKLYGANYDILSEICVTSGATEALFCAITAVVNSGDEVIIIEPAYDSYVPAVALAGGKPVYCSMTYPGYKIDWNQVQDAVNEKTKAIIINSPHNPTGSIFDDSDISALQAIVNDTNIYIISDEVYEHIIFDNEKHRGMFLN